MGTPWPYRSDVHEVALMTHSWLTIVTVVRDDPEGLARTVKSVSTSDLHGVEYLVVDSSEDNAQVRDLCGDLGTVHWIEPEGIYPAMNFGLTHAAGTYVQFLNAGDIFHDSQVLSRVRICAESLPAWMFGPVEIVARNGGRVITPPWDYLHEKETCFSNGYFPQHQGTFARTELLKELGGFDDRFTVAADYAAFLRLSQVSDPLTLDFVVADFFEGGSSSSHWRKAQAEFHRARQEILAPKGKAWFREQTNTRIYFAKLWFYRKIVQKMKRWN